MVKLTTKSLKGISNRLEISRMLPAAVIKDFSGLIAKIEFEITR